MNLDWRLARHLPGHEGPSVVRIGWGGINNGELLRRANDAGFEALITMDGSMEFQQNIAGFPGCVVVLKAASNRLADTAPLMPQVLALLPRATSGALLAVGEK